MPKLYAVESLEDPRHYFPSAQESYSGGHTEMTYNLDVDFPAQSYIHLDHLSSADNLFWIELRKDVERLYQGDVFYMYYPQNYRRWWNTDATADYNKKYNSQKHGYWTFYFEEESDQAMFIMKYSEILSQKRYRFHPDAGISCQDRRYAVSEEEKVHDAWRI